MSAPSSGHGHLLPTGGRPERAAGNPPAKCFLHFKRAKKSLTGIRQIPDALVDIRVDGMIRLRKISGREQSPPHVLHVVLADCVRENRHQVIHAQPSDGFIIFAIVERPHFVAWIKPQRSRKMNYRNLRRKNLSWFCSAKRTRRCCGLPPKVQPPLRPAARRKSGRTKSDVLPRCVWPTLRVKIRFRVSPRRDGKAGKNIYRLSSGSIPDRKASDAPLNTTLPAGSVDFVSALSSGGLVHPRCLHRRRLFTTFF